MMFVVMMMMILKRAGERFESQKCESDIGHLSEPCDPDDPTSDAWKSPGYLYGRDSSPSFQFNTDDIIAD